jgi:ribosomal protein L34E
MINKINIYYKNLGKQCKICKERPARALELCKVCYDKHLKQVNRKYAINQKINNINWINNNKEKIKIYKKEWASKLSSIKRLDLYLRREFGLTLEQYLKQLKKQNHVCAICGKRESMKGNNQKIKRLSVDHNHKTNQFRGLLCTTCNTGIGCFSDNPEILKKAKKYLILGNKSKILLPKIRKRKGGW